MTKGLASHVDADIALLEESFGAGRCRYDQMVPDIYALYERHGFDPAKVTPQNARRYLVQKMQSYCGCGSGEQKEEVCDARGIFVAYVCSECREQRLAGYRPDIFTDSLMSRLTRMVGEGGEQ